MSLAIETITPEMAKEMLLLNENNRKLRPSRVAQYADDMARGAWLITGEPIILNGTTLLNGQHRLAACVSANVPFTTAVFRGASTEVYRVLDSGLPRSAADVLNHEGVTSSNVTAAAARLVLGYEGNAITGGDALSVIASRQHIADEVLGHRGEYEIANRHAYTASKSGFKGSAWAATHVLLSRMVGAAADDYFEGAETGALLVAGDPRLVLRNWVSNQGRAPGMNNLIHFSVYIRSWNQYVAGKPTRGVKRWHRGEPFPRFRSLNEPLDSTDTTEETS